VKLLALGISAGHTRPMCVILTRAGHFLTIRVGFTQLSAGRGNQRCENAALDMRATSMEKESTPLWAWLSIVLMAIGAATYVTVVYLIEHVLTFFESTVPS
jgi:hypothetical protein